MDRFEITVLVTLVRFGVPVRIFENWVGLRPIAVSTVLIFDIELGRSDRPQYVRMYMAVRSKVKSLILKFKIVLIR